MVGHGWLQLLSGAVAVLIWSWAMSKRRSRTPQRQTAERRTQEKSA